MTNLPINPKIRTRLNCAPLIEADERKIKNSIWMKKPGQRLLFLQEGLVNTMCFPSFYGAFFVLNYERHLDGLLDYEQLDRFVDILYDKVEIPYLKAVHPQLDIDAMVAGLLRERRCNTQQGHLLDRINMHGRLPSWKKMRQVRSDPRAAILVMVIQRAPLAIAMGHSKEVVLEHLIQELEKAVAELDVHPALKRPLRDRFLDHFLIGYPELWSLVGAHASRFLGEPMIKNYIGHGFSADRAVVTGKAGKPLIRIGGQHYSQEMAVLFLDYLQTLDPSVLDAQHLLLDGSRSHAWLERGSNLESRIDILEQLTKYGIVHPALKRIEGLAGRLSEEGQQSVITEYLRRGSRVTEKLARAIIGIQPELHDWALGNCSGYASVLRLAQIRALSAEQIGDLPNGIKRKLLEVDLGV